MWFIKTLKINNSEIEVGFFEMIKHLQTVGFDKVKHETAELKTTLKK